MSAVESRTLHYGKPSGSFMHGIPCVGTVSIVMRAGDVSCPECRDLMAPRVRNAQLGLPK